MGSVTYDDRSFLIDGQRINIVSGEMHYFRTPAAMWEDRLLKARRAGLNCISTYAAWNFHEMREGQWDFTGDRDIVKFVTLAHELGLYVILRPGPYICAEWDFGGLPAWLTSKSGIAYRTSNAVFSHYFDKYFRQLLPRLADQQVSRNGSILLIQNENEYYMTAMPDRLAYLDFISQLFRRAGFDVPIITCNCLSEPAAADTIECVNAYADVVQNLKKLRLRQPKAPMLVSEFYPGWFDTWGSEHHKSDARDLCRRALEAIGAGGQINYYMWHGGTNFGFWASRTAASDDTYQTTSYDYDAPLPEGGGLGEKYYLHRLVNMFAQHMGPQLAQATMEYVPATVHGTAMVLNTSGPRGRWVTVSSGGQDKVSTIRVSLPTGKELDVRLDPIGAVALPVGVELTPTQVLDYSTFMPLGFFGSKVLVLHAVAGSAGKLCINGVERAIEATAGDEPAVIDLGEIVLVVINSDLAMRTWFVDEALVFGPRFVGRTLDDVTPQTGSSQYALLPLEQPKLTHKKLKGPAAAAKTPAAPKLATWKRTGVAAEPADQNLAWQKLDRPRDVDRLNQHYGYVWYRLSIEQDRIRRHLLYFTGCEDRATVFVNGHAAGVWGRGDGATMAPMPVTLKRGRNDIVLMCDNMGRVNTGSRLGELKGLFGPVYDAKPLKVAKFKVKPGEFQRRIIPRALSHLAAELESLPVCSADLSIPLRRVSPIHLSFRDVPHHAAIFCNERLVAMLPKRRLNYGNITLGSELRKGANALRIVLWGDVDKKTLDKFHLYTLDECLSDRGALSWRAWSMPAEHGGAVKGLPAWFAASFKGGGDAPLFVTVKGVVKGQVYINGHDAGRFWNVGPQQRLYLPQPWLGERNELVIFSETGAAPTGTKLEYLPLGTYQH